MKKILLVCLALCLCCAFALPAFASDPRYERFIKLYWGDYTYDDSLSDDYVTYTVSIPVENVRISVFDGDDKRTDYNFSNGGSCDVPSYGSVQISLFDTGWDYEADDELPWYARFTPCGGDYLSFGKVPSGTEISFSVYIKRDGYKYNNSYFGVYYTKSSDPQSSDFRAASLGSTSFNSFSSDTFEITCKASLQEDAKGAAFSLFLTELTQGNWEFTVEQIQLQFKVYSLVSEEIEDDAVKNALSSITSKLDSQGKKLDDILDSISGSANPVPPSNSGSIDDIGGLEDDIWDSIGSGSNDMNNAFDNAVDAFTAFRGGFAFFIAVFNIFVAPFWIQYLLWISLALGSVAALLGIGLNVAQHESTRIHRDREAWRREKQRSWERKHRRRR